MFAMFMWELFANKRPFSEDEDLKLLTQKIRNGARPEALSEDICPKPIWNLMCECWSSKPEERPTMDKVLEMVDKIRFDLQLQSISTHEPVPQSSNIPPKMDANNSNVSNKELEQKDDASPSNYYTSEQLPIQVATTELEQKMKHVLESLQSATQQLTEEQLQTQLSVYNITYLEDVFLIPLRRDVLDHAINPAADLHMCIQCTVQLLPNLLKVFWRTVKGLL